MIILDTHVWLWWLSNPENLSNKAMKSIDIAMKEKDIYISSISAWEIALLVARNRLTLTIDVSDWINKSESLPFINFIPVDNMIALRAVHLPGSFHNDPADRIIIATGLTMGAPIVTKDDRIMNYSHIETIW